MFNRMTVLLSAAVICGGVWAGQTAAEDLAEGFADPPPAARPQTWWHWMNGNITREGITADLEAMTRVGIGGVEIFNAVTNLWPNRLIGDEQLPDDHVWDGKHLKEWPQWLLDGKPSPTGLFTFTTWHHWYKDDAPLESGILGPVTLRPSVHVPLEPVSETSSATEKVHSFTGDRNIPCAPEIVSTQPAETSAGWRKYERNPVMGGRYGTCFDISVLKDGDGYRMWLSWRPKKSVALVESKDGIQWSEPPRIVLGPRPETGWEDEINRPVVLKRGAGYHMWYTGQAKGHSWIGYATSPDGVSWKRMSDKPVLSFQEPWEKAAVMCPHVRWDAEKRLYQMWYSGGEQYEPRAIGYATSPDGLAWTKDKRNPVFAPDPSIPWERDRVTGAQIEKRGDDYLMFYIGFRDVNHAQIGLARSKDGVSGWERHPANPIVRPGKDKWDHDACYKPYAIFDGQKWLLWYNGRHGGLEQIGVVLHDGEDLGFGPAPAAR